MVLMLAAAAVAGCMMKVNINFYDILFLYRHNYTLNNSYMKDKFCLMLQLLQATAFSSIDVIKIDINFHHTTSHCSGREH